nr:DNA topoisomerase 2 [Tanacetum cinerariifolium]
MADPDQNGLHFKRLLINFLHSFWPSLLKVPNFLLNFIPPIVKASNKKTIDVLLFYTMSEYEAWKEKLGNDATKYKIKSSKRFEENGLASGTSAMVRMDPWYKCFNGAIMKTEDTRYITKGLIEEIKSKSALSITELPVRRGGLMNTRNLSLRLTEGCLGKGVKVELDGTCVLPITFEDYVKLYLETSSIYEKVNDILEVCVGIAYGHFEQSYLWVFVNPFIDNPAFHSKTKENLTTNKGSFGSTCKLTPHFLRKIENSDLVSRFLSKAE